METGIWYYGIQLQPVPPHSHKNHVPSPIIVFILQSETFSRLLAFKIWKLYIDLEMAYWNIMLDFWK